VLVGVVDVVDVVAGSVDVAVDSVDVVAGSVDVVVESVDVTAIVVASVDVVAGTVDVVSASLVCGAGSVVVPEWWCALPRCSWSAAAGEIVAAATPIASSAEAASTVAPRRFR
jgi:hypothetical protein